MSEVRVPFNENTSDNAVLLLAAAEELGLGAGVVKTSAGEFIVPQEVYDQAFGDRKTPEKKTAAKRTAAKQEVGE